MTTPAKQIGKAEARALTDKIRNSVGSLQDLLWEAQERQAWKVLEYKTWGDYTQAEFGMTRQNAYRVIAQGKAERTITKAAGDDVTHALQISQRDAAVINSEPAVAADIQARVKRGEEPKQAVREAVKAADKTKPQSEPAPMKHRAPPIAVDDDSEETEELRHAVEDLTAENAKLKADNGRLSERLALYERDGVAETVKHLEKMAERYKQAEIRESEKMAAWMKSAKWWEKKAKELGYSRNATIDIETGEVTNG